MIETDSIYDNFKLFGKELCGKECQARKNSKVVIQQQQTTNAAKASEQQSSALQTMFAPSGSKSSTGLYVGIGVGVLILITIGVIVWMKFRGRK